MSLQSPTSELPPAVGPTSTTPTPGNSLNITGTEWLPPQSPRQHTSDPCHLALNNITALYVLESNDGFLTLPVHDNIYLDIVYLSPGIDDTIHFWFDEQECSTTATPSFAPQQTKVEPDGCNKVTNISWPVLSGGHHTFSISVQRADDRQDRENFTLFVLRAYEYPNLYGNETSAPTSTQQSSALPSATAGTESPTQPPGSIPSSSAQTSNRPIAANAHGSSKTRIIVPAVVVPVVVLLLLAALVAFIWRRRTRAKMAPSAAFKMENPTFTPGETWVPIDEKRAFSPGPTKVGEGSSL